MEYEDTTLPFVPTLISKRQRKLPYNDLLPQQINTPAYFWQKCTKQHFLPSNELCCICFRSNHHTDKPIIKFTMYTTVKQFVRPALSQFPFFLTYTCYFECVSVFTRTNTATCSALRVPGWCTHNGQEVKCETLATSHFQVSPSWLCSRARRATNLFSNFWKWWLRKLQWLQLLWATQHTN